MTVVLVLWTLAMVAGLSWASWSAAVFGAAMAVVLIASQTQVLNSAGGWLLLGVLILTPWFVASQRNRDERKLKELQRDEAKHMSRLQESARSLLSLQMATRRLENDIAHITAVYHVTKQTSRALHVRELFDASLVVTPRFLNATGLRLIDFTLEEPSIARARRAKDGRLVGQPVEPMIDLERKILSRVKGAAQAECGDAASLACAFPDKISQVAWAPLWREQRPVGVLIADDLPKNQLETLSTVANQLSLQLSRVHLYQQVEAMAVTDALTGLFVRRYFMERLEEELARAGRHKLACTLIMADLDNFKEKNDNHGHLVGDVVLKDVAQLLKRNLREIDMIARYGGEEFILLLVETTLEQAKPVAERLRQLVEIHPIRAYDELLSQTISIGLAAFPKDGIDALTLIDRADQALYAAKHGGRNRVATYDKSQAPSSV